MTPARWARIHYFECLEHGSRIAVVGRPVETQRRALLVRHNLQWCARRRSLLSALVRDTAEQERPTPPLGLLENLADGRAKLYTIWRALGLRRRLPRLFEAGDYTPLKISGAHAQHACAFLRTYQGYSVLTLVGDCMRDSSKASRVRPSLWTFGVTPAWNYRSGLRITAYAVRSTTPCVLLLIRYRPSSPSVPYSGTSPSVWPAARRGNCVRWFAVTTSPRHG